MKKLLLYSLLLSCFAIPANSFAQCAATCAAAMGGGCNFAEFPTGMPPATYEDIQMAGGENTFPAIDVSGGAVSVTQCFEYTHTASTAVFTVLTGTSTTEVGDMDMMNECGSTITEVEIFDAACTSLSTGSASFGGATMGTTYIICVTAEADNGTAEGMCEFNAMAPSVTPVACATTEASVDAVCTDDPFTVDLMNCTANDDPQESFLLVYDFDFNTPETAQEIYDDIVGAVDDPDLVFAGDISGCDGAGFTLLQGFTVDNCFGAIVDLYLVPADLDLGQVDRGCPITGPVSLLVLSDASAFSVTTTAPVCDGTPGQAQLIAPDGMTVCATVDGTAGTDQPVGCMTDMDAVLAWDFTTYFDDWTAAGVSCDIEPANVSGMLMDDCVCVPVELLYVKAEEQGVTNLITWATATELDNSHFEVERSVDGQKYEPIGKVDGAGTTVEEQRYEFVDANPSALAYYRLKQVDFAGTFEYSDVVVVDRKNAGKGIVEVYPVPTADDLNVQYEVNQSRDVVFTLTDVLGRVLSRQVVEANQGLNYLSFDMTQQTTGLYFLTYSDGITEQTRRVLKN